MSRTKNPNTVILNLQRQIARQEHLLRSARKRITSMAGRVTDVLNNQKHYLRHRATGVLARQKSVVATAAALVKRMQNIPRLNFMTSRQGKRYNVVFMCTNNEARKLRALVDVDFRQFNSSIKRLGQPLNYSKSRK